MKAFHFDCFAVYVDEWTHGFKDDPSEPNESPDLLGFFLSIPEALEFLRERQAARIRANEAANKKERIPGWRLDLRAESAFIIPLKSLATRAERHSVWFSDIENSLEDAVKVMRTGTLLSEEAQLLTYGPNDWQSVLADPRTYDPRTLQKSGK